ncbi:ADP-ribose diphosphatase [Pseudaeromonas sharmana]|uniref:ADP-ribose pyrophosphatase n=1 Tax=Pseudaeromonas sharmana TaxID=328412 RepID=A0ABV8CI91_9GAMM
MSEVYSLPEPHFSAADVEILQQETCFKGFFRMNRYTLRHRLFAGGWSAPLTRELFERGHAAAMLPYDPSQDTVVLLEQFRIGAVDGKRSPWLLEMVAGIIEPGEASDEVIEREAAEEAGLSIGRSRFALSYLVSPGGTTERIDVFIGEVDSRLASGLHGLAEEGEDIRVHVVSREQAYRWVESGRIDNAATVIALQWLQLHLDEVRRDWGVCA